MTPFPARGDHVRPNRTAAVPADGTQPPILHPVPRPRGASCTRWHIPSPIPLPRTAPVPAALRNLIKPVPKASLRRAVYEMSPS